MRTLPAHYIPRPRLVGSTTGQRVVVVEAGAGYGKSTLAVELVQAWGAVEVEVAFHEGGGDAGWFATQLRYGILKAGFSGAAAAMPTSMPAFPIGAVGVNPMKNSKFAGSVEGVRISM